MPGNPGAGGRKLIWTRSSNMGRRWQRNQVTVYPDSVTKKYTLIWQAVKGSSFMGDIALDDIQVDDGACKDNSKWGSE